MNEMKKKREKMEKKMKIGKYQWEKNNNIQCNKYNMIWSVYNYIVLTSLDLNSGLYNSVYKFIIRFNLIQIMSI